jgi:hypothetical protein
MNVLVLAAGILSIVVGVVHSGLGEARIFAKLRRSDGEDNSLVKRYFGILWASWHFLSVLGCSIAAILIWAAVARVPNFAPVQIVVALGMTTGAVLVFFATKARHLGWVGLLGVGVLLMAGLVFEQ